MIGYVLYTDGGCRPNPDGYGGAGIHGYKWDTSVTNKGIGHNSQAATLQGYAPRAESADWINSIRGKDEDEVSVIITNPTAKVTPVAYFDHFSPIPKGISNNVAELMAARLALEHFEEMVIADDAQFVTIRTDSRYVIDNFNNNLHNWLSNGFVSQTGSPIQNQDLWILLDGVARRYEARGIKLVFSWVRGHGECIGNNSADWLATMGVYLSRVFSHKPGSDFTLQARDSDAEGYWKSANEYRHPFLSHRFEYFNTDEDDLGEICMSNQGKDRELIAKRISDGAVGLVRIKETDPIILMVREFQREIPSDTEYLVKHDLDATYDRGYRYLRLYLKNYLIRGGRDFMGVHTCDKSVLTEQLNPPYLAGRMADSMDVLRQILDFHLSGNPFVTSVDITDTFFDKQEEAVRVKKGEEPRTKTVYKLRADIPVGHTVHNVTASYKNPEGEILQEPVRLTMGVDIIDRNSIRKLDDKAPKISLVTWKMGADVFLYATVIEAGEDVGIWAGMHSNMRVLKSAEKTKKAKASKESSDTDVKSV